LFNKVKHELKKHSLYNEVISKKKLIKEQKKIKPIQKILPVIQPKKIIQPMIKRKKKS
jgi:hypothetical protein